MPRAQSIKKNKKTIKYLYGLLKKLELNPQLYQDKRYNCKRVRVYSKELFSIIEKNNILKDKPYEFNLGYVSGMIDSEGHVDNKKSCISIVNTNKRVLEEIQDYLHFIKIESNLAKRKLFKKDRLISYRLYIQ